jgi:hypothetical protein
MALEKELISAGIDILFSSVGLVAGKVYDILTNRLRNGDLVDEELRQIFVRDLSDIKSKLDCLSLKELDASCSFLEEGVELLNLALYTLNENQTANESNADEATRVQSDTASVKDRFTSAKECFKKSREAATYAFHNKSMSIKHRIVACMLRVAARILESGYKDPEAATRTCLVALKDLHRLPAIQEIFAVFLEGGLKSMLKRAERLEHIMSVLFINHTLFNFASKDSSNYPSLITWPGIQLRNNRTFYPILNAHDILAKISRVYELVKQLNQTGLVWRIFTSEQYYAVNKRGEIILLKKDRITVIYGKAEGESKYFIFDDPTESSRLTESKRNSLAVDSNGNVYALKWLKTSDENGNVKGDFVLYVFDEHYNMKHVSVLDFLDTREYRNVNIAVDENRSLIMIKDSDGQVFVCDERGERKFKFKQAEDWVLMNMSISDNNDIMIISHDRSVVETYSLSEGNLKLTKEYSEGHKAMQVAFHPKTCQITVFAYVHDQERDWWFSFRYSEDGDPESNVPLFQLKDPEKYWWKENINIIPREAVAVAMGKNMIFI